MLSLKKTCAIALKKSSFKEAHVASDTFLKALFSFAKTVDS